MVEESIVFKGVSAIKRNGVMLCEYSEYIKARKAQHKKWSEKIFCDWCDKYNIEEIN